MSGKSGGPPGSDRPEGPDDAATPDDLVPLEDLLAGEDGEEDEGEDREALLPLLPPDPAQLATAPAPGGGPTMPGQGPTGGPTMPGHGPTGGPTMPGQGPTGGPTMPGQGPTGGPTMPGHGPTGGPTMPGHGPTGVPTLAGGKRGGPTMPAVAPPGGPTMPGPAAPEVPQAEATAPGTEAAGPPRRRRWWLLAALLLVGGASGVLTVKLVSGGGGQPAPSTVTIVRTPCRETPGGCTTTATTATFQFVLSGTDPPFECALDGPAFSVCTSPITYTGLSLGSHRFAVRLVEGRGAHSPADVFRWRVVRSSPPPPTTSPPPPAKKRPDLVVAKLDSTSVTVRNRGDGPSRPSSVSVAGVGSFPISALQPGGSATVKFASCQSGKLIATVDPKNVVKEENERNNTLSAGPFTTCPVPDLEVSALDATSVTVRNAGQGASGSTTVSVTGAGSFPVPALAAGASSTSKFSACHPEALTATVDPSNAVKESDETNNTRSAGPFTTCPLPDLVVSSLSATGVTVKNAGTGPSGATTVSVSGLGSFPVPGLVAGAAHAVTFPACTAGALTATVDPANSVKESDETNNKLARSGLTCPLPDLVVSHLSATGVTVRNVGNASSGATSVSITGLGSFPVPGLQAGAFHAAGFPACTAGTLTATVDPANAVKESDESNNRLTRSGLTCPLPDLVVSSLSATGVTVRNIGKAPSGATTVSVTGVGSLQVPGLKAGAFHPAAFPACTAGTLTAKVDPGNAVKESDDANNSLTRSGLTCPLPDLVIGRLNVTTFTVSNHGKGDAGAFSVLVKRSTDGGATFGFVASFPFSGLSAGGSRSGKIPNCVAGILRATADSGHQVKESNESNNVRTATVTCPLPDLIVSSVAGTSVTVQNVGHAAAGPFVIGISDPAVSPINVSGLAAGASRTGSFAPCLTSYTATADANNQVQESKENNNQKSGSSLPCPDLIIKALTKTSVTVLNQGNGSAGASQTRVQPVGKLPTQPLGPGKQQTFTYPCVANVNMSAVADVDNQVAESVEGNNQATAGPFTCPHAKPGGSSVRVAAPPAVPAWRRD